MVLRVATCGRNNDKLYQLQTSYADKSLLTYTADVSNETDCQNFINETIKVFGTIDILINNAGISMRALFSETELETLKKVMDINFWGTVYCTKYALPYMTETKRNYSRCIIYCRLSRTAGTNWLFCIEVCSEWFS